MGLLDDIFGPGFASSILGNPLQASTFADAERQNRDAEMLAEARRRFALAARACDDFDRAIQRLDRIWPPQREPGIYWTRTGGKTHSVEIVR